MAGDGLRDSSLEGRGVSRVSTVGRPSQSLSRGSSHLYQVPSSGLTSEQQESAFREALAHLSAENDLLLSSQGDPDIDCNHHRKDASGRGRPVFFGAATKTPLENRGRDPASY